MWQLIVYGEPGTPECRFAFVDDAGSVRGAGGTVHAALAYIESDDMCAGARKEAADKAVAFATAYEARHGALPTEAPAHRFDRR